jgi:hypothetical protein
VSELLKHLWGLQSHRANWVSISQNDQEFYIRFVNMLLNDVIFHLDNTLKALKVIKDLEVCTSTLTHMRQGYVPQSWLHTRRTVAAAWPPG